MEAINVEKQITVYDNDGREVGKTFSRRALQLTKTSRAVWQNDERTKIRLTPPNLKEDYIMDEKQQGNGYVVAGYTHDEETLFKLAKARVAAKQRLKWHILMYLLVSFSALGLALVAENIELFLWFFGGSLVEGAHVTAHIWKYFGRFKATNPSYKDPVEAEYRKLKLMEPERIKAELNSFAD